MATFGSITSDTTITGTGAPVLGTAPTLSNPIVGTQSAGDNSTKAASTAYADNAAATASKLVTTLTASENLTTGQPVGTDNFVAGNIARANRTVSQPAHGVTTPVFTGANNTLYCAIGGDKFAYLNYTAAASDTLFAQVGSIDRATNTATLGTAATVATAFTPEGGTLRNAAICKLDTDKFVVFYVLDSSTTVIKYRVATVSGTTITFGTEATFATAGSTVATSQGWCADFISTNKGIMVFKAATTTNSKMFAFTASGTVLTVGTGVTPGTQSQVAAPTFIKKIATDKYVLVTMDAANSVYAQVCTLSGTTITAGTEVQISNVTSSQTIIGLQVVSPATDVFVVRYRGSAATIPSLVACTVSGTTPTAGTPVAGTAVSAGGAIGGLYALNSTTLYVSCGNTGATAMQKFTLSGTTLTLVGIIVQPLTSGNLYSIIAMDNGYMATAAVEATTTDVWIQGMSNNYIGIVQSSPTQTQTASVIVSGIDANQSGLLPGGGYLVSNGTLTFVSNSVAVNTLDDVDVVKAISATQIIV